MKLVFTCHLRVESRYSNILDEISDHASRFYNMTLYEQRNGNLLSLNDYYYMFRDHPRCKQLQMHTYSQAIKQAIKDMKSYSALKKKYDKNPDDYKKPGLPRYKGGNHLLLPTFMKTGIRHRNGQVLLSLGKQMKADKKVKEIVIDLPKQVDHFLSDKRLKMITLKAVGRVYECHFVYELDEKEARTWGDYMSIDLGVNNLAAITYLNSCSQYLIDGKGLKSKLSYYNKVISTAYSKEMKIRGSKDFRLTKKIKKLMRKRAGFVDYYIHKASRTIVDLAIEKGVQTLVVGDFKYIKNKNRMKYFVSIPHSRLIQQISYKCKLEGIGFVLVNESYTSGVSSLDLEEVNKDCYDVSRRLSRGLFTTKYGYINADINGSLNILRKYLKDNQIPRLVDQVRVKGFRENPKRLFIV